MESSHIHKKVLQGKVVSNAMQKTIVVEVDRLKTHQLYQKKYKVTTRYKAHDEKQAAKVNDMVLIEQARPMSKEKRWVLKEIMTQQG